jgi:hypothetical protein
VGERNVQGRVGNERMSVAMGKGETVVNEKKRKSAGGGGGAD